MELQNFIDKNDDYPDNSSNIYGGSSLTAGNLMSNSSPRSGGATHDIDNNVSGTSDDPQNTAFDGWLNTQLTTQSKPAAPLGGIKVISKQSSSRSTNASSDGVNSNDGSPHLTHHTSSNKPTTGTGNHQRVNKSKQRGKFQSVAKQEFDGRY